ncbi:MAG: hypothetical protein ABIR79_25200, partial [Candidatus Binatia bacterium]
MTASRTQTTPWTTRLACVLGSVLVLGAGACTEVGNNKLRSPEEVMAQRTGPIQRGEYRLMAG